MGAHRPAALGHLSQPPCQWCRCVDDRDPGVTTAGDEFYSERNGALQSVLRVRRGMQIPRRSRQLRMRIGREVHLRRVVPEALRHSRGIIQCRSNSRCRPLRLRRVFLCICFRRVGGTNPEHPPRHTFRRNTRTAQGLFPADGLAVETTAAGPVTPSTRTVSGIPHRRRRNGEEVEAAPSIKPEPTRSNMT